MRIVLSDKRTPSSVRVEEMHYEGGVEAFVKYLDRNKTPPRAQADLSSSPSATASRSSAALWWNDGYHEPTLCFTNNIPQRDGGTHLAGFRGALTRQVTGYAESGGLAKKEKVALTGDDCREGPHLPFSPSRCRTRNSRRRPRTSSSPPRSARWSRT